MKSIKSILFYLLIIGLIQSCGPRSGINSDKQTEEAQTYNVDTSSPAFKKELALVKTFDKGKKLFRQNCAVCHAGRTELRLTGPGLKGISERLPKPSEEWFIKYILNSDSVLKSGDKYARKLKADNEGVEMQNFAGQLTTEEVKLIYSYLISPPRQNGCVIE